ncbi:hypothetical protein [Acidisoma cladoniae]|uniref:hypothetical protein n=1 Tax=Acidisoma cladoniae TaxID=3040935 RepID=UPI002549E9A8|nr:hypothetical protein [Acidisoma sp. PAMC 29798]
MSLVPATFYSEIPLLSDVRESFLTEKKPTYEACFNPSVLDRVLEELEVFSVEFDPPETAERGAYSWRGGPFSFSDAMAYYCLIRRVKPATVFFGRIICLHPYPSDFLSQIPSVAEIIAVKAETVLSDALNAIMRHGDILLIDSTYTVKHGSDCLHIYLQLLPELRSNLTIYAHDIYLPATMPLADFITRNISWTEQYLLGEQQYHHAVWFKLAQAAQQAETRCLHAWALQRGRCLVLVRAEGPRVSPGRASDQNSLESAARCTDDPARSVDSAAARRRITLRSSALQR